MTLGTIKIEIDGANLTDEQKRIVMSALLFAADEACQDIGTQLGRAVKLVRCGLLRQGWVAEHVTGEINTLGRGD